jgi:hypothetical protein
LAQALTLATVALDFGVLVDNLVAALNRHLAQVQELCLWMPIDSGDTHI